CGLRGPFADWVTNWTSDAFRAYVAWIGERLDGAAAAESSDVLDDLRDTFHEAVDYEVRFWTAFWVGV
ncbi:MAG: hypothetical protein ACREQY_02025, partial [Candidatus Binatia bacterium]